MEDVQKFMDVMLEGLRQSNGNTEVFIAPPAPYLASLSAKYGDQVQWAAQQCSAHGFGAYTGEHTASMIASVGVKGVLIGHSERREAFGETEQAVQSKVDLALEAGLRVFLCCGESLDQRTAGFPERIVCAQLESALQNVQDTAQLVIAYEPIWAIGTGMTATSDQAQDMHHAIRNWLTTRFGPASAQAIPILYGGSCKPSNAAELFGQPDVNGGLIGGASLEPESFLELIRLADESVIGE